MAYKPTTFTEKWPGPQPEDDPDECTCYTDCNEDSHSGQLHQHEDEPCPVHDESVSPIVG